MKTQNLFMKGALLFSLLVMVLMLWQCACCPPTKEEKCLELTSKNPTFSGCWMTEYSRPRDRNDSIKEDIVYQEIPMEIKVNSDSSINGRWWGELKMAAGQGVLQGRIRVEGGKIILEGIQNVEALPALRSPMKFTLSDNGLAFDGTYDELPIWGKHIPTRTFYWKGNKISNCNCANSIFKDYETYKIK
jgi:hypothetical protein